MITLRHLRYFTALARHRHFGRAAAACFVSQPALSVQIREMEEILGGRLFERDRSGVLLTPLGQEIEARAEAVLSDMQDIMDLAHSRKALLEGPLRLGVIPSIAPYVLPAMLPLLRNRYPALELSIREAVTQLLLQDVESGQLDAVLLALPVNQPRLTSLSLFRDDFCFIAPAEMTDDRLPRRPTDIATNELLLLEEGHCMRDQTLTYCRAAESALRNGFGASSLSTIVQMVANGYGATLLPAMALPMELRGISTVRVVKFDAPPPSRTVGLVWRTRSARVADFEALGAVIKASVEQVEEMPAA